MPIVGESEVVVSGAIKYHVDLVMCIDATGSMAPVINEVKSNAKKFYQKFVAKMTEEGKTVQQLRVKVITFRDYAKTDYDAMVESPFYILGDDQGNQTDDFVAHIDSITAAGGGDLPENSLEALALAFKSNWCQDGDIRRHITMMFTDATATELGTMTCPGYPAGMPASFAELREMWDSQEMELRAKRLLIYAPDCEPWTDMVDWDNTFHAASPAGTGLPDVEMDTCIHMLVKSI